MRKSRKPAYHSIDYVGPKKDYMTLNDLFLPWLDDDEATSMIIIVSCYLPK